MELGKVDAVRGEAGDRFSLSCATSVCAYFHIGSTIRTETASDHGLKKGCLYNLMCVLG